MIFQKNIIVAYRLITSSAQSHYIDRIEKIASGTFRVEFKTDEGGAGACVMGGGLYIASIPKTNERPVVTFASE